MKTILAILLLVAMLALPMVIGSPGGVPSASSNAPVIAAADNWGVSGVGPGFSGVGKDIVDTVRGIDPNWVAPGYSNLYDGFEPALAGFVP